MSRTIACQTLDFFIRFRAGGCFVTPCQGTLQIRKTPWRGVTKQPPAVPLPRPNVTPEPNEKIKGLAGNCSRHTKQATRHPSNQENTLARRNETASCRPLPGPNVTPEPNEKIKGLAGNCSRHTKQATRCFSDVWPGQRDGRRLFRHAAPGCFPDLKGVLWLVLCAWNNCLPDP